MTRGWYYNKRNGQKFLSFEEIADTCGLSAARVRQWFQHLDTSSGTLQDCVDAGEAIAFLVRNSMPVSHTLLPPKTKKLLLINSSCDQNHTRNSFSESLCAVLSNTCNLLIEQSSLGKFAKLSLLTFSPDVIGISLKESSQEIRDTIGFIASFPETKTVLYSDTCDLAELKADGVISTLLILEKNLKPPQIADRLQSFLLS